MCPGQPWNIENSDTILDYFFFTLVSNTLLSTMRQVFFLACLVPSGSCNVFMTKTVTSIFFGKHM